MTLLLVGSLGTSSAMWDPLRALLGDLSLLALDHRGHGGLASAAPPGPYSLADLGGDVLASLDARGLERVDYCGLSLGGMVGMWLAVHHPERIGRLVLCNTSAHLNPEAYAARAREVRAAGTVALVADGVLARWLTPLYTRGHPAVVAGLRAQLVETAPEGYAGCCEAIAGMDLRPELGRIAAPTLCVAGREDPATPPELLRLIADAVPDGRLEVLSPAAHLSPVEQAPAVAALIFDHLRSHL